MTSSVLLRRFLAGALAAGAVLALTVPADAAPGRNGRIAFTSGREEANDNNARLYMLGPVSLPGTPVAFTPLGGQARHPSWSPDRTKLVYAVGTFTGNPATEEYDLFVKDFVADTLTPLDGTQLGDGLSSDHPTWSPDGTRIAYETQTVDNSVNREIMVKTFGTAAPAIAITASPQMELKPAWTADSQTLLYARQNGTAQASNYDIHREAADGNGSPSAVLAVAGEDEYQPAVSPDGSKLCFTRQTAPGNTTTAEINVTSIDGTAALVNVSDDAAKGDINCVWSPDGRKIAYSNGVFSQGRLVMVNADDTSLSPTPLADDAGSNNFDGNADWAADGSPECPDTTITTRPNTPVTIPLECVDTGPAYERTDPNGTVSDPPANGTLSDDSPTTNPSTVRYTPKAGFTGTDTLQYLAFDAFGFGTDKGTITIRVQAPPTGGGAAPGGATAGGATGGSGSTPTGNGPVTTAPKPTCAGLTATIVGTARRDRLTGTRRRDVIVAGRGNDVVRGAGGDDVVCAGPGNDSVRGDAGNDRLFGEAGGDRLTGGAGRDRLSGGTGRDRCTGGPGRDVPQRCETRRP